MFIERLSLGFGFMLLPFIVFYWILMRIFKKPEDKRHIFLVFISSWLLFSLFNIITDNKYLWLLIIMIIEGVMFNFIKFNAPVHIVVNKPLSGEQENNSIVCKHCQMPIEEGINYCKSCGKSIV